MNPSKSYLALLYFCNVPKQHEKNPEMQIVNKDEKVTMVKTCKLEN